MRDFVGVVSVVACQNIYQSEGNEGEELTLIGRDSEARGSHGENEGQVESLKYMFFGVAFTHVGELGGKELRSAEARL